MFDPWEDGPTPPGPQRRVWGSRFRGLGFRDLGFRV